MTFTQKILVPTDFSPASILALDAAALLSKQFGAEIVLLYVYDPSLLSPFYALPGAGTLIDAGTRIPDFEKSVRVELQRLRETHFAGIANVELASMQRSSPADAICEHAKSSKCDLIVISTHGRTGLAHMMIGSVAEKVVRHAPCPVLTLRSKAD
jgi:nucleotide-binding universal stress UspA family protein